MSSVGNALLTTYNLGHHPDDADFEWWEWYGQQSAKRMWRRAMATRILSFCPKSAKSTLVLGCGSSPLTGKFPGKVTGLDINPWKTRFVEGKLPNVTFVTRDIRDPLGSLGEFDLIVASEVLEHIPARELSSTVSKLCGLLSLGGRFVVAAPDYDNWLGSLVETLFHDYHYRFSFEDLDWDFAMQSFKFVGKRRFFWDTVACYKR